MMCGIAGIVQFGRPQIDAESVRLLRRMASTLAHRGPDDEQLFTDGPLGLAFRRLSVIDVQGGRQPLLSEDEEVVLCANGEIYNAPALRARLAPRHRFRTGSDCEVLVHLYEDRGLDFLDEVNGMFAAAIWDRRARRLILARDRLGIKPLFYHLGRDLLIFASELKALLVHPACPRAAA